jgi:L-ascorbate metabolism protein UlaG (beta-lactamase superfamily)
MSTSIRFLGVAGYEVTWGDRRLLMDPFLSQSPVPPVRADELERPDVILVSHAAFDHLGDTAAIAKRTGCPVICGGEVRAMLMDAGVSGDQIRATTWGIVTEVAGIVVRPVECHHWSQGRLSDGQFVTGVPMGFIVETEPGIRLYHYGDTAIFSDLKLIAELYEPTIGLLGCAQPEELFNLVPGPGTFLTGEMSPREAALSAEYLGLTVALACHYFNHEQADVREFLSLVGEYDTSGRRQAIAPVVGETLVVSTEDDGRTIAVKRSRGGEGAVA